MDHIAIDLGSRKSQLCIRNETGEIVLERQMMTRSLSGFLRKRPKSRVVMETCAEAFGVADAAIELGHEVRVVPATLVRALGVGARGIKTDVRDGRAMSEASVRSDLPSVHIPSLSSREGKVMCNLRDSLIKARTMLINAVRGYQRTQGVLIPSGASETFPDRVARALETKIGPSEALAEEAPRGKAPSKPRASKARRKKVVVQSNTAQARKESTIVPVQEQTKYPSGLSACGAIPTYVDRALCSIRQLTEWIEQADQELTEYVAPNPVCQRLMSVPGVGPVCATRFVTTIDAVERFSSADELASYLGLVPGEHQSSNTQRRTGTIKCGAASARAALVQSAWCLYRMRKTDPMVLWALEVEKRRGKKIAITALARKLAIVMFAMWRDGTYYSPVQARRKNSKQAEDISTN